MYVKGSHYLLYFQIEYLYFQCIFLLVCRLAILINSVSGKSMTLALQCSLKLVIFFVRLLQLVKVYSRMSDFLIISVSGRSATSEKK